MKRDPKATEERKTRTKAARRKFAELVAGGTPPKESLRQAGSKAKDGALSAIASRMLDHPEVQARLAKAIEEASQGRIIDARRRREILSEIAEGKIVTRVTVTGPMGNSVQEREPSAAERKAAIEELNKMDRIYEAGTTTSVVYVAAIPTAQAPDAATWAKWVKAQDVR